MSVCSLDWGAIATIVSAGFAGFVAWLISQTWNHQKGSEVISSECKNLWYELDRLDGIYRNLERNSTYRSENHDNFFSNVKSWKEMNISKINLIESLLKESGKNIENINLQLSEIKEALRLFDTHYMLRRISSDGRSTHESVDRDKVLNIIDEVKKSLIPFIIYKKSSDIR